MKADVIPASIKALMAVKLDGKPKGTIDCPRCSKPMDYALSECNGHAAGSCKSCGLAFIE